MSVFRPSNINRRLVGTATTNTNTIAGKGSPGNGGQIGPKKTPYLCPAVLGSICSGGCCGGVFKLNESQCGIKEGCKSSLSATGFFICCGPGTTKWFVASCVAQVSRNWFARADAVTLANSCLGSCGWFVPSASQLTNPGMCCKTYWDFTATTYWSNTATNPHTSIEVNPPGEQNAPGNNNDIIRCVRAFRCTAI